MLDVRRVSKRFDDAPVLEEVSLSVRAGERLALVGPSGAGKTTLMRLIAGLERPDSGEIYLDGTLASDSQWQLEPSRRKLGFVFQKPSLWPHLTVFQNIAFGLRSCSAPAREHRVEDLLRGFDLVGLSRRYPGSLSGGEARRVELARTLAPSPRLLLLDEPFTHFDARLKTQLEELVLGQLDRERTALVLVTHDLSEAARLADQTLEFTHTHPGRLSGCRRDEP